MCTLVISSAGQKHPLHKHPSPAMPALEGDYVGLYPLEGIDPERPKDKWFRECTLLIRGEDLIINEVPIVVRGKHKEYSASDGGFVTYRGRLFRKDGKLFVSLRIFMSNYIIFQTGGADPYSSIEEKPVEFINGAIRINGVEYKKQTIHQSTRLRLLKQLWKEPMEFNGRNPYFQKGTSSQ